MHCPRCGQQQVSEEIKFCSRCGLPLGVVSEVVAQGGYLTELSELQKDPKKKHFNKKNGVAIGVFWFIFFVLFLAWMFGGVFGIDFLAGLFALIGISGALIILIGSLVFLPSSKAPRFQIGEPPPFDDTQGLYGAANRGTLPPQQSQPVSSYVPPAESWKAPDTGDFAKTGTVTDSTTKLLNNEE